MEDFLVALFWIVIFFFPLIRWLFVKILKGGTYIIGPKDPLRKTETLLNLDSFLIDWKKSGISKEFYIDIFRFSICVVRFMLLVTVADGRIDEREMNFIMNYFRGSDPKLWYKLESVIVHDIKKPEEIDIEYTYKTFRELIRKEKFKGEDTTLFFTLIKLASVDDSLDNVELNMIFNIMRKIGWEEDKISAYIFMLLQIGMENRGESNAYNYSQEELRKKYLKILDLPINSDFKMIREKYLELAKRYHPDRYMSLGEFYSKDIEAKMKIINEAYNWLKDYYRKNN